MKKATKTLSILLCAMILCLQFVPIAADETQTGGDLYTPNPAYAKAVTALQNFDMLPDSFDASKEVTRGDFLYCAMQLIADKSNFAPCDTNYSDVTSEAACSGAIAMAASIGICSGYSDGTFRPDMPVTNEQAVKILVSILGYDVYAAANGGYPAGYLTVASMYGIMKKVSFKNDSPCRWDAAAQLILNAMHTDILKSDISSEPRYYSEDGKNPMTENMNIFCHKGTVSANSYTALADAAKTTADKVRIDNIDYLDNGTDTASCIGYPVEAYYKIDANDTRVLMSVVPQKNITEKYVDADDIIPSPSTTELSFYSDDFKTVTYAISSNPIVIYNNKVSTAPLTGAMLAPANGSVTLIDINSDDRYEMNLLKKSLIL